MPLVARSRGCHQDAEVWCVSIRKKGVSTGIINEKSKRTRATSAITCSSFLEITLFFKIRLVDCGRSYATVIFLLATQSGKARCRLKTKRDNGQVH